MYCYRCHAKTYDGQKYCIKCGAPLNEDSSESCYGQPEIQDSYDSFTYSGTERRGTYSYQGQDSLMVYIGIGVIVLVIIVFIVVGIVILGSNSFPTDQVSTGDVRNESAEKMLDLPDNSPSSPKKPQVEITEEPGDSHIAVAKRTAALEYDKYLDRMDKASFMKTAISNGIHMDMLNRQPDDYVGKEVYFGGTVIQVIYDDSDMSEVQMQCFRANACFCLRTTDFTISPAGSDLYTGLPDLPLYIGLREESILLSQTTVFSPMFFPLIS